MGETLPNIANSDEYVAPKLDTSRTVIERAETASAAAGEHPIEDAVQEAIQDNPDKEPFDYQKFVQLYWRKDLQGDVSPGDSPTVQAEYRRRYYLDFKDARTTADFARQLEDLDARAGN